MPKDSKEEVEPTMILFYSSDPFWVYYCATKVEFYCNTPFVFRPKSYLFRERKGYNSFHKNI